MNYILTALIVLGIIAIIAAVVLYVCSKRFAVAEDPQLCTACGACAKACPRGIIELRPRGPKDRRLYVACMNKDRGPAAVKACDLSCIGCGKCAKECSFDAIAIENNLAYIDPEKCRMCRKCEKACPRHAIVSVNFPTPKPSTTAPTQTSTTSTSQP